MVISDIQIRLADACDTNDRILAYVTVAFDSQFVVHDIKIINSQYGPFIAMPSRRIALPCPQCGVKNGNRNNYCCNCGNSMPTSPPRERMKDNFMDIAHPISSYFRSFLQSAILDAYHLELANPKVPT